MTQVADVFSNRYEIQRGIARGGMAEVYLARDQLLDRPVAVKVLFPEFARDPSFVERFRREAQSAANLNHPNIVGIYDWGQEQGTYFIVMEYVRGRSIREVVQANGAFTPRRTAQIGAEIAGALEFAHRNGVIHREGHGLRHRARQHRRCAHPDGSRDGHGGVLVAGAGPRAVGRRPLRRLLARCRALRDGDRGGAVPG